MTRFLAPLALLLAMEAIAAAQAPSDITITSFDPENAVAPVSTVEGAGVKVGEGTVLHPVVGIETGFVSNVFYTPSDPQAAGVLRVLAQVGAGNLEGIRLTSPNPEDSNKSEQGEFQYRASLRASYDQMLSGDQTIRDTGGLGLGALFRGLTNPAARWSFGFSDEFDRLIRAANFETDANTNRDINSLGLNLIYHPSDSTLGGQLYYQNTIDVFEKNTQDFADRMMNVVGIQPSWRWLPQTVLSADVSMGINTGIGGSKKVSSFPLSAAARLQTLLSLKTTFGLRAGYTNGFYSAGQSYSSPTIGADLGYRYSPFGRVALTYDWIYADSVNANYYRDHVIRLWFQQLAAPFVLMAQPEVHFREYNGVSTIVMGAPDTRDDVIFSVVAGAHYIFRNWLAITLDYRFTDVSTNYRYMAGTVPNVDPSFVRHELLLGVRAAL